LSLFIDTSAFLALLDADAAEHLVVRATWEEVLDSRTELWSTSYVLVETCALLQARLGMDAVRVFTQDFYPLLHLEWPGQDHHADEIVTASLLTAPPAKGCPL